MGTLVSFTKIAMAMKMPWPIWLLALMAANLVVPLFFLPAIEAVVVLIVFMAGAVLMMALFARFGFVRLLGIGHILWLGLVPWLFIQLGHHEAGSTIRYFLVTVIAIDTLSLIIDIIDVVRYLGGDRAPQA